MFQTDPSRKMTRLASYTVTKLRSLEFEGQQRYLPVGGLEVATSSARLAEPRGGLAGVLGCPRRGGDARPLRGVDPLLDRTHVLGGLQVPTDGIAKAVRTMSAQVQRAADRGVRVPDRTEVLGVRAPGGRVIGVSTSAGEFDPEMRRLRS